MKKDNNRFEIKPSKMNIKNLDNKEKVTYNDALEQSLKDQEAINEYLNDIANLTIQIEEGHFDKKLKDEGE